MPHKQINSTCDYVSVSNEKNDLIVPSHSIELPLDIDEILYFENCIVVYFDYDYQDPFSNRTYKLFKHFCKTTKELIENEFKGLGKIQGLYILSNISEKKSIDLIKKLNKKHLSV